MAAARFGGVRDDKRAFAALRGRGVLGPAWLIAALLKLERILRGVARRLRGAARLALGEGEEGGDARAARSLLICSGEPWKVARCVLSD